MDTKRVVVDPNNVDRELLKEGAAIIREGGLVAFPTETVYGLGANALDEAACQNIYTVKGRPQDNPLIVHIADKVMIDELVSVWTPQAELCAKMFWPGPLTLVLPKSDIVPDEVTGGLKTIALRMPSHNVALALIKEAGVPIAAPSANLSGKPSPSKGEHVWEDLKGKIPMVIDAGPCKVGLESTVLDLTEDIPTILRPGGITREELQDVLGEVALDTPNPSVKPKAPGMKYRHYAPEAEMILIRGNNHKVVDRMLSLLTEGKDLNKRVGILCTAESEKLFKSGRPDFLLVLGSRHNPKAVAASLFEGLRLCDERGVDLVLAEGIDEGGLGLAIMNRLEKAASHKVLYID